MKTVATILGVCIFLLPLQRLSAQEEEDIALLAYSPAYVFREGLFLSIEDVRANDPIPFARIQSDRILYDKVFFDELIIRKDIIFYDNAGVRASVKTKDVWGYSLHGRLYIMVGGRFQQLMLQGAVSQFMASETTHERAYYDDEDSSSNYTTTQDLYRGFYRERYYYRNLTAEGRLFLYDFESNSLEAYELAALEKILERDSILFSEYNALNRRGKKKRMVEFIRRYNQDNPLYFPAN